MKHEAEQFPLNLPPAHKERTHHKYGMSQLNYLDGCPGYKGRSGTSQAAEDGTRLHEIMDRVVVLLGRGPFTGMSAKGALERILLHETVTEDEEFYLRFCCDELDGVIEDTTQVITREENVSILRPDGSELNNGYYDTAVFLSETTVVIFDWKFGWLPVPAASGNLQGMGYSTAFLQKYPKLKEVQFVFVQPKLHRTTHCFYQRELLPEMYQRVRDVIARAEHPDKKLRPGMYCDYCALASTCTALLNDASRAVAIHEGLPMPQTFTGLQINTAEDAAKALYVLDRLEVLIKESGLKDKAKEFAKANGGRLECEVTPGKKVIVELGRKNLPRSANSPALIADVLKEFLTPEQVLSACDPSITRLEEIFAEVFTAQRKDEADGVLEQAEFRIEEFAAKFGKEPDCAKAMRSEAKAKAKNIRTTKKQAREVLAATLLAEGLVSAPSGQSEYLKVRIEPTNKEIQNTNG